MKFHQDKKIQLLQRNVAIMQQYMHNKKVAEEKAKSISLINASLLWHFEQISQVADLQAKIKHQDIKNKRIQNRLWISHDVTSYFKGKLRNRLQEADEKIESVSFELSISKCFLKCAHGDISSLNIDVYMLLLNIQDQHQLWTESIDEVKTLTGDLAKKKWQ